jgi:hypothetical protein
MQQGFAQIVPTLPFFSVRTRRESPFQRNAGWRTLKLEKVEREISGFSFPSFP